MNTHIAGDANDSPRFSFLMAVHRLQPYLAQAIQSVLDQTSKEFEFYVIANNCENDLWNFLQGFDDPRIRLHRTSIGQLAYNLNYGIDLIGSGYVLRMDGDDVCLPDRLERTRQALQACGFPDVLAGGATIIDGSGRETGRSLPAETHDAIVGALWWRNSIVHPACAFRAETIKRLRGYCGGMMSEDYDLWLRARRDGRVRFAGVAVPLIKYRVHGDQARGHRLGYAESAGHLLREMLLKGGARNCAGAVLAVAKTVLRSRREG